MRQLFIAILLIFGVSLLRAQTFPPFFEIKSDTIEWQDIDPVYWQVFEDNTGKLRISDLKIPQVAEKFHYLSEKRKVTDSLVNSYWFRYRLKNVMNREAKISLNSMSEYDDFYVSGPDSNMQHFVSGYFSDRDIKDGLKNADCIPLVLQPGQELMVYQRIFNHKKGIPSGFAVAIVSTEKTIHNYYIDRLENDTTRYSARELQEMFLEGVLLLSFVMNLFFFRIVRKKEYLYFSLFVLSLGIDRLINVIGVYLEWEHPSLKGYYGYINLSWIFILFFLVQFIRQFFKGNLNYPRWDKFLLALAIIAGLFNIYVTFSFDPCFYCGRPSVYFTIYSLIISVTCLSAFITFLLNIRGKESLARLVITGGTPLMLFWGLANLLIIYRYENFSNAPSWLNSFLYSFRPVEVGCTTWFVIFFTLILFKQFNRLRKQNAQQALDKERLERERETERREIIEGQKLLLEKEVEERTAKLKHSLEELKATQNQLIQSEKMASLGELTAGIAHEIQNPLNFVNNFSEVNKELLIELKQAIDKGNPDDVKGIANDIIGNQEKINHHGKRADAIVKGMLQHSRSSIGVKEPTNINGLCDEYLRLAYHGLRAKDKSFNPTLKTEFDNSVGKINIIPQDIGRVILNLINNAFYAVGEKQKQNISGYEPAVTVSTKKLNDKIEITVKDNGNGISQKVLDKIFQPFFTTKPTGQGTGLGLSLAYDIVKAHRGEIKVETNEGKGSTFTVAL